jgi:hypothetical protein
VSLDNTTVIIRLGFISYQIVSKPECLIFQGNEETHDVVKSVVGLSALEGARTLGLLIQNHQSGAYLPQF